MHFKFLTVVFDFDSSETDVKEKVKNVIKQAGFTLFVDEYANGLKFLIGSESLGKVATTFKKEKLDGGLLSVEGKDDEFFIFLSKPKAKINPSSSSFQELDTNRLNNLF